VVHVDGTSPWTAGNVSLKIDNVTVTPTFSKVNDEATVSFIPSPFFVPGSTHTAQLTYPGTNGPATTLQWQFTVANYVKDVVSSRVANLQGGVAFTSSGGGHTAAAAITP